MKSDFCNSDATNGNIFVVNKVNRQNVHPIALSFTIYRQQKECQFHRQRNWNTKFKLRFEEELQLNVSSLLLFLRDRSFLKIPEDA